jgi:hypothetical protein
LLDKLDANLDIKQRLASHLIKSTFRELRNEVRPIGLDFLARFEFGDDEKQARIIVLTLNPNTNGFEFKHKVELKNEVAPSLWFVSTDISRILTLDEIDKIGVTENTIVIYNLENGTDRSFAIEDFISATDLGNIYRTGDVRLWREEWLRTIRLKGPKIEDVGAKASPPFFCPIVEIDMEKMEVNVAVPYLGLK